MGSINTRSVKSSHVPGLSTSVAGSEAESPALANATCFGPIAPRFRYTDEAPGPRSGAPRGGPRPAVHREGHRTAGRSLRLIQRVRDIHSLAGRLVVARLQR